MRLIPARTVVSLGPETPSPRAQLMWALLSVIAVTLAFTTVGVLYLRPPDYATYRLHLPETGGLTTGDSVRIAGVKVGRVLSIRLGEDHVDVEFIVRSDQRLGDRTAVDVRMLTPVGGLYLALLPAGAQPLRAPIPMERAHLPFLVNELIPETVRVTDRIDTESLRKTLDAAARALTDAPGTVRQAVSSLGAVVGALAEQKEQVQGLLALSDEYLATARDNEMLATEVIRAYAVLGPQIVAARSKVEIFADKVTAVVGLLFDFLAGPYAEKLEPLFFPLEQSRDLSRELLSSTDAVIAAMTHTMEELAGLAGPEGRALIDQSGLTVRRPDVCLPVPGAGC
ncbi:MlaD family protein [Nocardia beijingensis]|uniref:MlaD family protein n=1 Tax=Nocardia beijingensis TaxID=95162 RepID=UPI0018955239|nr:MlaD family protein [Nocardia beijingensis]MBF6076390.1 MCE family protein [Nocardia beijingensis]